MVVGPGLRPAEGRGVTRADQERFAHMLATEDAVWNARRQALVTRAQTEIPMTADEAIILYGMALRHLNGRIPLFTAA